MRHANPCATPSELLLGLLQIVESLVIKRYQLFRHPIYTALATKLHSPTQLLLHQEAPANEFSSVNQPLQLGRVTACPFRQSFAHRSPIPSASPSPVLHPSKSHPSANPPPIPSANSPPIHCHPMPPHSSLYAIDPASPAQIAFG